MYDLFPCTLHYHINHQCTCAMETHVSWLLTFRVIVFFKAEGNIEEKLLLHVAIVAKCLDDNIPKKTSLKLFQTSWSDSFKCWQNFLRLNSKGPYLSSMKGVHEMRKFHVTFVQWRLRNLKKGCLLFDCHFANINIFLFCRACCHCHLYYLSSQLLWCSNFGYNKTSSFFSLFPCP